MIQNTSIQIPYWVKLISNKTTFYLQSIYVKNWSTFFFKNTQHSLKNWFLLQKCEIRFYDLKTKSIKLTHQHCISLLTKSQHFAQEFLSAKKTKSFTYRVCRLSLLFSYKFNHKEIQISIRNQFPIHGMD